MGSVNVSASGTGTVNASAYGLAVGSDGSFSFDGAVNTVMGVLDSHAPAFVKSIMNAAAQAAAEGAAIEAAYSTAIAALPAELGAEAAVFGAFVPVAAIVMAIPVILLALDPASSGAGCCGSAPAGKTISLFGRTWKMPPSVQRFGSCSPKEWDWYSPGGPGGFYGNQWAGDHWANYRDGRTVQEWHSPNPGEEYVGHAIIGAFNAGSDCWHYFREWTYPIVLAAAIGAWNRTHSPNHTVTMPGGKQVSLPSAPTFRMVNVDGTSTWQGRTSKTTGNPDDPTDPISVALNAAAQKFKADGSSLGFTVPRNTTVKVTINTGPVVKPQGVIKMDPLAGFHLNLGSVRLPQPSLPATSIKLLPIHMALGGKPAIPAGIEAGAVAPKGSGLTTVEKVGIGAAVVGALGLGWHFLKG